MMKGNTKQNKTPGKVRGKGKKKAATPSPRPSPSAPTHEHAYLTVHCEGVAVPAKQQLCTAVLVSPGTA